MIHEGVDEGEGVDIVAISVGNKQSFMFLPPLAHNPQQIDSTPKTSYLWLFIGCAKIPFREVASQRRRQMTARSIKLQPHHHQLTITTDDFTKQETTAPTPPLPPSPPTPPQQQQSPPND